MTDPIKLKSKDVKELRLKLLLAQDGLCALCKFPCSEEQAVVDHCHKGGWIRAVLHRGCNSAEGRVMKILKRSGVKEPHAFLRSLIEYHILHETNQTGYIHPTHFTAEEKVLRQKARVQRAKAKAKKTQVAAKKPRSKIAK